MTDELRAVVEPLLLEKSPKPKGDRPRVDERTALTGILREVPPKRWAAARA